MARARPAGTGRSGGQAGHRHAHAPGGADQRYLLVALALTDHILDVHDLHAWTITSGEPTLSAHVVVADHCFGTGHTPVILDRLLDCLGAHFGVRHSTFQFEPATHAAHEAGAHK